ncbi:MFS family permease [Kitasatospora sp. MAA4]|uniref:MFS transporter n=1 Tax=Kitasatospora sp. MAA4 TaxID=3035093 RepID=UPI002474617A|nr:MFS transporter [Kitasatospora sp. MAA4]MDH6132513.1 MFS family permease [Kitasatospora sp. MAA4]
MALAILVNTLGSGLFLPLSALYFTQVVGLRAGQVALGLGIASVAGVVSGIPLGRLADRQGARQVQVALLAAMGVLTFGYVFVATAWQFTALATLITALDRGVSGVAAALVADSVPPSERVAARAYTRSVVFFGLALGSSLSAVALRLGTPLAYRWAIALDAATFLAAAALYLRLPRALPRPAALRPSPWQALRDRPYVTVTGLFSVLGMYNTTVTFALPLWVLHRTSIPGEFISLAFAVNTIGHVLLQVPVSRRVRSWRSARRTAGIGGISLLLACCCFAATARTAPWPGAALLTAGVLLNLTGGLCAASAQFYIAFGLAPEGAQGQYQGLVSSGASVSAMLAPTLSTLLPLGLGEPGWALLGALFVGASLGVGPVVNAGIRRLRTAQLQP